MEPYPIEVEPKVIRTMSRFPEHDRRRIAERIDGLATDPRPAGCEKLAGGEGWRIRSGDYRVVFWLDDEARIVTVTRVGQRGDVYRRR